MKDKDCPAQLAVGLAVTRDDDSVTVQCRREATLW